MIELFDDLSEMLVELHDAGARFLVVGGVAVSFHGHQRATKDRDIWVDRSPENAHRVVEALRAYGAPLGRLNIGRADFERT